jgi:hypothetical protein
MASTVRRVGAAGLMVGLCLGAASAVPASAGTGAPAPAVGGVLGAVDGGLLGGLVGSLLHGQGGVFGPDGGVFAGTNTAGDVVQGLTGSGDNLLGGLGALSAVGDALANPQIGGNGSFGSPSVGGGPVGGVVGGLLGGGGLLGSLLGGGGAGLLGGIL